MKILLFVPFSLTDQNSAWLLFKKILSHTTEHEITILSLSHKIKPQKKYETYDLIHYTLLSNQPIIRKIVNKVWKKGHYYIALYSSKYYAKQISKIIEKKSIQKIWIFNDMLTVLTISELLKDTTIPYHVSIFDDMLHNKYYKIYGERLENEFIKTLKNSTSIDVIVPEQKDFYIENNIIKPSHSVAVSYAGIFKKSISEKYVVQKKVKKICVTGSVFGLESFATFCSAVEEICTNEKIEIHIYTNYDKLTKLNIEKILYKYLHFVSLKQFVPEKEIINTILKYDIAYIQAPFNSEDKHKAITSFPSKTHNYLSSTVPILLHSPDYAAISKFLKGNNLCYSINTINEDEIKTAFIRFLNYNVRCSIRKNIMEFNDMPNNNLHFENISKIIASIK